MLSSKLILYCHVENVRRGVGDWRLVGWSGVGGESVCMETIFHQHQVNENIVLSLYITESYCILLIIRNIHVKNAIGD